MQNPWKLTTLLLGGALLISNARAETDWRQNAIAHLESAAKILVERGGGNKTKPDQPTKEPEKKGAEASPMTKALQLTRAAIVQLKRAAGE